MTRPCLIILVLSGILALLLPACSARSEIFSQEIGTLTAEAGMSGFGTQEVISTQTKSFSVTATSTLRQSESIKLWTCNCLPTGLISAMKVNKPFVSVAVENQADVRIIPLDSSGSDPSIPAASWTYLLAAPFPTVQDAVTFTNLKSAWLKDHRSPNFVSTLLVSPSTLEIFTRLWGVPDPAVVKVGESSELLKTAWDTVDTWAIIPFEEIDPRWKIMRINGFSPLDSDFKPAAYPLTIHFGLVWSGTAEHSVLEDPSASLSLPETNLEPDKLSSLIMTGTTALVRYTAQKMEENGVLYPARDIAGLLRDADITHISNEVSFYEDCPPANPVRLEQRFCSDPSYFELLEYIDADVIELTGNHILDWGSVPFLDTLQIYRDHQLPYFGGGKDLNEASQPYTLRNETQSLVFIGCSPAGPETVWANVGKPGSNPCREGWMETQIKRTLQSGSLPVVTFQHLEVEDYIPHSSQRIDFQAAAKAGAVIVSGSQSHFAQTMTFVGDRFVHYGLGNLFFDQMYGENPHEFVDKHFFYNGRYISTVLITLMLEDASTPRRMEASERAEFLQKIFEHCNWDTVFWVSEE